MQSSTIARATVHPINAQASNLQQKLDDLTVRAGQAQAVADLLHIVGLHDLGHMLDAGTVTGAADLIANLLRESTPS